MREIKYLKRMGLLTIVFLVFSSSANSFDIGGYTTKVGKVSYINDITKQLTDCLADEIVKNIPEFDICFVENAINKYVDKINLSTQVNLKFNLAGCSFSTRFNPTSCLRANLRLYCSNADNPFLRSKIKRGIQNYVSSATSKYTEYADSEILGHLCMTFEEKVAKTPGRKELLESDKQEKVMVALADGIHVNTRVGKDINKCVELARRNRASKESENECYSFEDSGSGISEAEIRESIHTEAVVNLAHPLTNKISENRDREVHLENQLLSECNKPLSFLLSESCRNDMLGKSGLSGEATQNKIDITSVNAGLSDAIETATTPYKTINFPTQTMADRLPVEQRDEFKRQVIKQSAQTALVEAHFKAITHIEKELAELNARKIETESKPFFADSIKNEIGLDDISNISVGTIQKALGF